MWTRAYFFAVSDISMNLALILMKNVLTNNGQGSNDGQWMQALGALVSNGVIRVVTIKIVTILCQISFDYIGGITDLFVTCYRVQEIPKS